MLDKMLVILITTSILNLVILMGISSVLFKKLEEMREVLTKSNEQIGYDIKQIRKGGK